jgi:hypothetical protein
VDKEDEAADQLKLGAQVMETWTRRRMPQITKDQPPLGFIRGYVQRWVDDLLRRL